LCEDQVERGLCRLDPANGQWRTLLGIQRCESLTADPAPSLTGVLFAQQQLWLATDRAGIGVYNPATHGWDAIHQAAGGKLLDNAVHDLLADPAGRIWIATTAGLNRVEAGRWERWNEVPQLVGRNVRRLAWAQDKLWYVTAEGGLGTFGQEAWRTVAGESGWQTCTDADVAHVADDPRHDQLWFLARNQTLGLYDRRTRSWTGFTPPEGEVSIRAIAPAADAAAPALLAATSRGAFRLDPQTQAWTPAGLDQESLQAIDAGPAGVVAVTQATKVRSAAIHVQSATPEWRTAIGSGRAYPGPGEVKAAAASGDGSTLFVGSSAGISGYSVGTHSWTPARKLDVADKQDQGAVIDLQADGPRLLALTQGRSLVSWDPASGASSLVAGGERFGGNLADVTAVTRDAAGNLWLATDRALYTYAPGLRNWGQLPEAPEKIQQLVAARDGVWALAGARAYFCTERKAVAVRQGPDNLIRLFASPETSGAVALAPPGRLYQLVDDEQYFTVVGDPAEGLDLQAVTQVAAVAEFFVVGGQQPCLYDALSRSWRQLQTGPVAQVVAADGQIWLRTARGQIFSCLSPAAAAVAADLGGTAIQLAARGPELAALLADGSIQVRKAGANWTKVKDPAAGPGSAILAASQLQAAAVGDVLYLAGGPQQRLWQFGWTAPAWQVAQESQNQPLSGVTQLAVTSDRVWALAGGAEQVFSAPHGEASYRQESLAGVRQIRALGDVVTALDAAGDVWLLNGQANQVVRFSAPAANKTDPLEMADLAELPEGLLVAGQNGSAILSRGLASWSPVGGAAQVSRLHSAPGDGSPLWATSARGELYQLVGGPGERAWQPVVLDGGQTIASLTVGAGAQQDQSWACLSNGGLLRLRKEEKEIWHQPDAAPGGPQDVVGVVRAGDSFLVAFRNGKLARCRPGAWEFAETPSPAANGIDRLLCLGPAAAPASYWLLAGDGQLHVQAAGQTGVWRAVATGVQQVFAAGELLLAVGDKGRRLQAFDAAGTASDWWNAPQPPPLKAVVAAGELVVQEDRVLLVLSDGQSSAAYDPQTRQWLVVPAGFVEFAPLAGALLGRTAEGRVARLALVGGAVQIAPLDWGGKVLRITGAGDSATALGWLEGGRLVLADDRVRSTLIGGKLGPAELWAVAASGERCFAAAADRNLYVYESSSRDWRLLRTLPKQVTHVPRLLAEGQSLWLETTAGPASGLFRLEERNGGWDVQAVCGSLAGWERAGGGVLARVRIEGGNPELRYYASAAPDPLTLRLLNPAGPREQDVVAARSSARQAWLYTRQGELWSYVRGSRSWTKCLLPQDAKIASAVLDCEPPVLVTDRKTVLVGRPKPVSGGWDFVELARDVVRPTAVDADGKQVAFATSAGVFVNQGTAAEQAGGLQFNSAFAKERQVVALAAAGAELFAASEVREVSAYDLARRRWRPLPLVPWDVQALFVVGQQLHVEGRQGELACLDGERWVPALGRSQATWKHQYGKLGGLSYIPPPASSWSVRRDGNKWSVSLAWNASPAIAVSLDPGGRLGIDDCAGGLALYGDRLFVATTDALLEYTSDLGTLRGVTRPGRYVVRADRPHNRVLTISPSREVQAYDGQHWASETLETFQSALAYGNLTDSARPLTLTLPGAGRQPVVAVEYRGSRLLSDTPSPDQPLTTNGREWFLGTLLGVSVLDRQGGLMSVHPLAKGGVAFAWGGPADQPVLHVRAGDGSVCTWNGSLWEPCQDSWEALQSGMDFEGHLRHIERVGNRFRLSCPADKLGPELWLDPAAGGFTRDAIRDVLFTGQAAWTLAGADLERLPTSGAVERGRWSLGSNPQEASGLRMTAAGPVADFGSRLYRLSESGPPQMLPPDAAQRTPRTALLAGRRWSIAGSGERMLVTYQSAGGTPLTVPLDTAGGWGWDQLRCAAIGGGKLLLETAAGSFQTAVPGAGATLPLDDLQPLAFGNHGQRIVLEELWVSSRGGIWGRSRGPEGWLSLDAQQGAWQSAGNLPDVERQEFDRLCQVPGVTWRRKGRALELAEATPGGESIAVLDPASRRFACDQVSAALEQDGTLWLLTPAGLRQIDLTSRRLLAVDPADGFRESGGEFLRVGSRWLLKVKPQRSTEATYYERQGSAWQELAAAQNPWLGRLPFVDWGYFRTVRNGNQWEFALRADAAGDSWRPCRFQPRERRFDFQTVRAAVASGDQLLTETPLGILTWKRRAAGYEYASMRGDLDSLDVSPDRSCAVAATTTGNKDLVEHRAASGWAPRANNAALPRLRTESRRWRVLQRTPQDVTDVLVNPDGTQWFELPLHAEGDFEFRRPQQVLLGPEESGWTLAGGTVVRYQAAADAAWTPQSLFAASELPGRPPPPYELFLADETVHVAGGGKVCAASGGGAWQAADAKLLTERQQRVCEEGGWTWVKPPGGELRISRQVGGQPPLALQWERG
ncbi:MAG: hypothetical protein NTY19_03725, partial [Planctomycetota bacterium]|nr:hypothetical protein [Planctomycetota bacterium]